MSLRVRGSIWLLIILTLGIGAWVLRPSAGSKAQAVTASAAIVEVPAPPEEPCLKPPQTTQLEPPQIPVGLPGRIGLYVARFEPGEREFRPSRAIAIAPQEVFPLASNYKTSVWLEVLRQVDAGQISLGEKFVVTPANQSLGDYPYDNTDIEGLAQRMIQWSDNTATDILHRRVGLGSLQPIADGLKLCQTRLLLPTKAWWVAEAGLGGEDFPKDTPFSSGERFAKASPQERLRIAERLDAAAQQVGPVELTRAVKPYFEGRYTWEQMAQIDRNIQNASTPLEWARFLWAAFEQNGLSDSSNALFRKVMSKGYGSRYLRVRYAYYGGKSGNTAGVLGFTGYLETADGCRYLYVFLSDTVPEVYTGYFERPAFSLINRALLALGAAPKG